MVGFPSKSTKQYSVRSVSFPGRSHPSTLRMEEKLNKLRCWQGSNAETLCTTLFGLAELYICIEDLLNLPLTRQALAQSQNDKWNNELLDCSLKHLDLCGSTRDAILSMKQSARELQSALRRSKVETNINAYICSRKTMKKEIEISLASLKRREFPFRRQLEQNYNHLSAVADLFRKASLITSSIFHTLLLFLSPSLLKPKPTKWSLVSKLVQKGLTAPCEEQHNMNELESVDVAVTNLLVQSCRGDSDSEEQKIQSAQEKLECLDAIFQGFEDGLECLFRRLIHTRVSLLNILSH